MKKGVNVLIKKALKAEGKLSSALGNIAYEAQKYVDWNEYIGCEYMPSDGICISDGDMGLCPITRFFEIVESIGTVSEDDFYKNTI